MNLISSAINLVVNYLKEDELFIEMGNRTIPLEIMQKIFEGCDASTLQSYSLVCRSWHQLLLPSSFFKKKWSELMPHVIGPRDFNNQFYRYFSFTSFISGVEYAQAYNSLKLKWGGMACPYNPEKRLIETHDIIYFPKEFFGETTEILKLIKFLNDGFTNICTRAFDCSNIDTFSKCSGWYAVLKEPFRHERLDSKLDGYEFCEGSELLLYLTQTKVDTQSFILKNTEGYKNFILYFTNTGFVIMGNKSKLDITDFTIEANTNYLLMTKLSHTI